MPAPDTGKATLREKPEASPQATQRAIVAGHICLDIIPTITSAPSRAGYLVVPGKRTHIGPAKIATGGAVSNTGIALHKLGIKTRLCGKIGQDRFGEIILDILREYDPQLASGMMVDSATPSSYTIVISSPEHDRSFLHCEGANGTFDASDIEISQVADAALFHFGYPTSMRRIYADGGNGLARLLQRIKEVGVTTSLDTSYVDADAPAGSVNWREYLARVLPYVDLFLPSFDEIFLMLQRTHFLDLEANAGGQSLALCAGIEVVRDLATEMLKMGVAVAGIKLGDQGFYLRTTSDLARLEQVGRVALSAAWANREFLAPAYQVNVVGTTGAGDCAVAGLLASALRGLSPEKAVISAVGAGAYNVEVADATSGIPSWEVLQARIGSGWPTRPVKLTLDGWRHDTSTGLWHSPADHPAYLLSFNS